ncbi:replication initiation protein [Staphylococcus capitis]|uniref:replication initiation protein n=1 Tax=Staphylococcus capitis TaxID=29388 RepID=UPI0024814A7E|nr:replication initiation protein [Staphylococcus capitis]MDH9600767.1 replication initiation protein [Staphylococcus capitis]MDH9624319.1 replication initiation protein [Staphylococcus capitis]
MNENKTIEEMKECGYHIMKQLKLREIDLFLYLSRYTWFMKASNIASLSFEHLKSSTDYPYQSGYLTYKSIVLRVIEEMDKAFIINNRITHLIEDYYIDTDNGILHLNYNSYGLKVIQCIGISLVFLKISTFSQLKSVYSKRLYKMLLDTEEKRNLILSVESLRYWLNIPDSYAIKDINEKILKYVSEDIGNIENNFKITKNFSGRKIKSYTFQF